MNSLGGGERRSSENEKMWQRGPGHTEWFSDKGRKNTLKMRCKRAKGDENGWRDEVNRVNAVCVETFYHVHSRIYE